MPELPRHPTERRRIVFLTHRLPYAPNRGDRLRAYHELRVLASRHDVHLVSLVHDADEASHAHDLDGLAASVTVAPVPRARNLARAAAMLATSTPLTHVLLSSPTVRPALETIVDRQAPDLVLAFCSGMARYALGPPLAGIPFLLDMVDVDSAKWEALGRTARVPRRWVYARESACLGRFEAVAARRALATFVVNEREATTLRGLAGPDPRVEIMENGVDLEGLRPPGPPSVSVDVVFCGVMDYPPNEEGALWLARDVWPLVRAARPDARLVLVGASPTPRVRSLRSDVSAIVVTGSVPDVRPYLWNAAVSAAPLHVARGVQNKVLEAVGAGLPAVITPVVAEGLPAEVLPACRVANSAPEFAAALIETMALSPDGRRTVADSARLDGIGWDRRLAPLLKSVARSTQ